jgi:anthranilate synthase component 1
MELRTRQTGLSADPLAVFEGLVGQHDCCFLLETLGDESQPLTSGQSYIGVAPARRLAARDGRFYVDGRQQPTKENPYQALRAHLKPMPGLPARYVGGLVGYISHEAIRYGEPTLEFDYPRQFFDFEFGQYDDGLIFRDGQAPRYFHYGTDRSEIYKAEATRPGKLAIEFLNAAKTKTAYQRMVEKARQDIQNGRVFQVVLANRHDYRFVGNLLAMYNQLRRINPSPFMFFVKFGSIVTLGASPELLAHTTPDRRTYIEVLAGTIRRGQTAEEDARLAKQLLSDPKEIAEHNMLVDLARNDVGRVSRFGSVRIDDLMYIKRLSHVQHICSLVSGQLKPGSDAFDALAAAFPAGTLVGAPKIEAAKMIAELEGYERGPYGGTVGYFGYNGDSVHAVNIRSVNAVGDKFSLHTGSGIVYDSRPDHEYQEISHKKAAMDRAMRPFLYGGAS